MGEESFKRTENKNTEQKAHETSYDEDAVQQVKLEISEKESNSAKQDEKQSAEILQEIEVLDGASVNTQDERDAAKKKLASLGKKYQDLDDAGDMTKAADKRVIRHEPSGLGARATEQKLRDSHLDEDFDETDKTLTLFSVLDTFLPNWESAIGSGTNATEQDPRGRAVRECADTIMQAVGETSLRESNKHIFRRAIEALGILLGGDGKALRNHFFDEAGRPNSEAIKTFAVANKELLTNPAIAISKENITPLDATSL